MSTLSAPPTLPTLPALPTMLALPTAAAATTIRHATPPTPPTLPTPFVIKPLPPHYDIALIFGLNIEHLDPEYPSTPGFDIWLTRQRRQITA